MEVRIERLRFSRGQRNILDIPELVFAHGSTTSLFGPNGSGKTTLLRLIAGLESPDAGSTSPAQVGFAFQRPVFIRGSVRANLELGLTLRHTAAAEKDERLREAAEAFGIEHLLARSAHSLSGGESQRVNLARALCLRSPVTLLDEPLSSLDRVNRARLLEELPQLLQTFATTTIIVTHDRDEAFRLAEHLVVLVEGRVRAQGQAGQVYRNPPDRHTAELLGYMLVAAEGGELAVPPGGIQPGTGDIELPCVLERIVDMGNYREAVGWVNGSRVSFRMPPGFHPPAPGGTLQVAITSCVRMAA